ncbi:amidohydrolase [Ornithinimicrobium cryptoxanthini]|uniref:amidohydrolase n=1 Tax=Ornithinimicrobium cryptoxanthini TaxID=2934161 RepID=UPI00211928BB|nr:amidohydrolase [Ornithinimicrobium cryptoxanthini]
MDALLADHAAGDLVPFYHDLHQNPELSFAEHRTAAAVAHRLTSSGFEVTTGVGRTGVVGVLRNGPGPTALLRADMDGLPVLEGTGLPYASTARGVDPDGRDVPVMHACGHDVHVTCLVGAAQVLAESRTSWSGTLLLVFQPAEELGAGAQAMIDDGLFERFPRPQVVLGQHVAPFPAGLLAVRAGTAFAAADSLRVTMFGRGAHGSRPEVSVDPVVMAAATVLRLQTIASREVAGTETAILTVGALRAGTKDNIIPDDAELLLSLRTFDEKVRQRVFAAISRIVHGEASTSGAPRAPEVEVTGSFPAVVNEPAAVGRTLAVFTALLGADRVIDPGVVTGSEDVGLLATAAQAPCVFWLLGGGDPQPFSEARGTEDIMEVLSTVPSNHSPQYAPVPRPTIDIGVAALVAAAREWLPVSR